MKRTGTDEHHKNDPGHSEGSSKVNTERKKKKAKENPKDELNSIQKYDDKKKQEEELKKKRDLMRKPNFVFKYKKTQAEIDHEIEKNIQEMNTKDEE
jgi:hypothetical protein